VIPRIIHQIFIPDGLNNVNLDDETIAIMKSWKLFHPCYDYKLWSLQSIRTLAKDFDPRVLLAIDACAFPAMKADIARLMILFLQGGVYIDLKLECIRSFIDEFSNHKLILLEHFPMGEAVFERNKWLINSLIMAEASHEFIRRALYDCVCNVEARLESGKWHGLWYTTGPMVLMRLQKEFLPLEYGQFENGVGVILQKAYGELFKTSGGSYNKEGRHWWEREHRGESLFTDCCVRKCT
jgi:mannosyltransferase OCH1-like enzyme